MNVLRLPRRLANYWYYRKTMPRVPQHNDFYLVEFPKSGVTWLSALLANVALIESGRTERASFTAAHLFVPDIEQTRDIGAVPYGRPPVRLIKSHARYNPHYKFLVYLVRNPLDVMKSYFRFNKEDSGPAFDSFDAFCRSERIGVPAWKRHVRSWLVGGVVAQRLHLCRYEDLLKDAGGEIDLISQNFGWNVSEASIEEAVRRCSMARMKEAEALYRARNPRYTMTFVGGSNEVDIAGQTLSYIESECRSELELLGYR